MRRPFGVVAAVLLAAFMLLPASAQAATAGLPGQKVWASGAKSFDFGTNDSINYSAPNFDTLSSVQSEVNQGNLTLDRTWMYNGDGDAADQARVAAAVNAGMTPMILLGSYGPAGSANFTWDEHIVSLFPTVKLYEFGNEPDNYTNGKDLPGYTADWNATVPALRAINPKAVFGGPAVMWAQDNDGSVGSYSSDLAYFLAKTTSVRADFVTYHDYTCTGYTSESACLADTPGKLQTDYNFTLALERQYYGATVPTGISEWNYDPGTGTLGQFAPDHQWIFDYTEAALTEIVSLHMALANQFTTLNYSGYGDLDMFKDSSPWTAKAQFWGMVDEGQQDGSGSTLAIPNPIP